MRLISLLAGLIFSASLLAAQHPAPPTSLLLDSGHTQRLADYQGQVVYLDFWASWCKPCRRSFPWMSDMQAKYADKGLKIIAVNLDADKALADAFLKESPANFTIAFDPEGKVAEQYQLLGMPSSYLIDRNGVIRKAHQGFFVKKQAAYEQEIKDLLAEQGDAQ